MTLSPAILQGTHVRLEPLSVEHRDGLLAAAADGALWELKVTVIPSAENFPSWLEAAAAAQRQGRELPFVIRSVASGRIVGTSRYLNIAREHRRVEIGATWLAASAQRTAINTEAKLLLLTHAFEQLGCIRVEFRTDVLNARSRAAILRLGAREEGILRHHMIMPDGRLRDTVCFGIVATEWPEVKARLAAKLR